VVVRAIVALVKAVEGLVEAFYMLWYYSQVVSSDH
jgi:hypothetical protein